MWFTGHRRGEPARVQAVERVRKDVSLVGESVFHLYVKGVES